MHCALCIELTPRLLRLLRWFVKFIEGDAPKKVSRVWDTGHLGHMGHFYSQLFSGIIKFKEESL